MEYISHFLSDIQIPTDHQRYFYIHKYSKAKYIYV